MSEYQPQMTVHSAVELVVAVVDTAQAESVLRVYREIARWSALSAWRGGLRARKCLTCSAWAKHRKRS